MRGQYVLGLAFKDVHIHSFYLNSRFSNNLSSHAFSPLKYIAKRWHTGLALLHIVFKRGKEIMGFVYSSEPLEKEGDNPHLPLGDTSVNIFIDVQCHKKS